MTVTWSTNESIINWTSSDDPAVTFQVVKIAGGTGGTGGGGGGVTDHGDLTGLADDDHDQYQYVNAVYTEADPFTITDESAVVTQGAAITLPAATSWQNRSVLIVAAAVDLTVTCHAGDTIAVTGGFSSTLSIPSQNIYQLTSTNFGGTWRWLQTARFGPAFDMPYWYGQSITQGHVIKMGASAPEWGAVTPGAHASTHGSAGSDPVTIAQSQVTNLTTDLGAKAAKASNLSDLASASTARTNLGLGDSATKNVGTAAGTVAAGDDSRLSDTRTPTDGSVSTAKIVDSAVTSAKIADGTIVNADISASAAIATSKISGLTTVATDTLWDAAGDLAVGSGADTAAKLSKGTRTQALVVGSSTLEWDTNHYNGGNFVSATVSGAIAETVPAGAGFGATTGGGSGVAHLHGIYLPKGVTITTISFVSGANAASGPTNQWFALCDSSRTVLRVTSNDTTTAWGTSTVKSLNLTSTYTTTYSGLHYLACCVTTTTTQPSFRGANTGSFTGVAPQSFTSTTGLTTPVAEGTTFAASTGRLSQALGIVS